MSYRRIMVQLDIDSPAKPRLRLACEIARRFEAELIGFAASEARPPLLLTNTFAVDVDYIAEYTQKIESRLKKLRQEFEMETESDGDLHAVWRAMPGSPTPLLATHAREADLLIVGTDVDFQNVERTVDVGALILSAGRPVLLPAEDYRELKGDNVLVAWNDTREARRAVSDALPFLVRADHVLVAMIAPQETDEAHESLLDVVRFLGRHGCKARSEVIVPGSRQIPEVLTETAGRIGADLMVFGGYGHSRLREWAMGGVTRALIHDGSFHRFVSS
ncbi:universal stress protein [Consotaella aegiceratis]|uniref:universal stress protein n=1 Tax=Consotaella aegiceratis TaxID=3097961 RepID=UPI002F3E6287